MKFGIAFCVSVFLSLASANNWFYVPTWVIWTSWIISVLSIDS